MTTTRPIRPTGPSPCQYMLIAERPGIQEARMGKVLVGPSGQEVNRFLLTESCLFRDNVYCTNVVKDYREGDNPSNEEVQRDLPLLREEIKRVQPRFILLMGLYSARAVLGEDIDLGWANGLMFPVGQVSYMPVIHTAATLHNPRFAAQCAFGFRQFGKMVRGKLSSKWNALSHNDNDHCNYVGNVLSIVNADVIAMDTEGTVDKPWGLSYSSQPGQAAVQMRSRPIHRKWDCVSMDEALVILHNALRDLPVLSRLKVKPKKWTDTLLMAALIGTEPQGLKALARRHCGLVLREYDDVVRAARREKAIEYLGRVLDIAETVEAT